MHLVPPNAQCVELLERRQISREGADTGRVHDENTQVDEHRQEHREGAKGVGGNVQFFEVDTL